MSQMYMMFLRANRGVGCVDYALDVLEDMYFALRPVGLRASDPKVSSHVIVVYKERDTAATDSCSDKSARKTVIGARAPIQSLQTTSMLLHLSSNTPDINHPLASRESPSPPHQSLNL